jgi:tetratricopeptide (TPR) repeat protein
MSQKTISITLMGLLSCLVIILATLITLDLRQPKPQGQSVGDSSVPARGEATFGSVIQETPPSAAAKLDSPATQPSQVRMESQERKPSISVSTSTENSIVQNNSQIASQRLYERVSLLTRQNQDEEAIEILQKMIQQNPNDLRAYALLGELYYQNDRLSQAIEAWEKALEADPFNEGMKSMLAKAQRERKTHSEFTHEVTRHFRIKFEGSENRDLYKTVLDILEEAYSEVGKTLSFYPDHEIIVFLYTGQQFFDVTRAPAWSGGIFDGKIRVPAKGYEDHLGRLRQILFHEYAHAVIHQMTEQGVSKVDRRLDSGVPTWLHEGIAQYMEPDGMQDNVDLRLEGLVNQGVFLDLPRLQGSFLGFNTQLAGLAYDESLSAVKFMIEEFGPYTVQRLLAALADQKDMDGAMRDAIFISYEEFQTRWKEHLKSLS